jgi:hypothetical protein
VTATNHALTGAAIGIIVGQPWLAIPLSLASHYVCDALPHYGSALPQKTLFKTKGFRDYLVAEAAICAVIVGLLVAFEPRNWLLAAICAFVAASPDLLSFGRYQAFRRGRKWHRSAYFRFAQGIQWFERPIGAVVEIAWLIAVLVVVAPFLR